MKTYSYSITLRDEPLFWLGDKFYKVEEPHSRRWRKTGAEYSSRCPSCNGTRRIAYKGYNGSTFECDCPLCKGSAWDGHGDRIRLEDWEVHEYIVYKVSAQGPEVISAYKDGAGYADSVSLTAFCRTGRCADDYVQAAVPWTEGKVDRDIGTIDMDGPRFDPGDYVFRKKAGAAKFLEAVRERDKRRLAGFNEAHGTGHAYPF